VEVVQSNVGGQEAIVDGLAIVGELAILGELAIVGAVESKFGGEGNELAIVGELAILKEFCFIMFYYQKYIYTLETSTLAINR
jgi:hypothetical protein